MEEFDGLKDRLTDGCRYKTVCPFFKKRGRGKMAEWNRSLLIRVAVTNNIYVRLILEESGARR